MQKITPFLWFDDKAEEAAKFYVSVFKNSKLGAVSRYGESAAKASGRLGHDRGIPARWTEIRGVERRAG